MKTVLTRNKILMSNETPNKNELEKAVVDLSRFDKLEINRVGYRLGSARLVRIGYVKLVSDRLDCVDLGYDRTGQVRLG